MSDEDKLKIPLGTEIVDTAWNQGGPWDHRRRGALLAEMHGDPGEAPPDSPEMLLSDYEAMTPAQRAKVPWNTKLVPRLGGDVGSCLPTVIVHESISEAYEQEAATPPTPAARPPTPAAKPDPQAVVGGKARDAEGDISKGLREQAVGSTTDPLLVVGGTPEKPEEKKDEPPQKKTKPKPLQREGPPSGL